MRYGIVTSRIAILHRHITVERDCYVMYYICDVMARPDGVVNNIGYMLKSVKRPFYMHFHIFRLLNEK